MKIISIIGTRPQYIKIKPLFDYCKKNKIDHKILDTLQHFSYNVSDIFIKEFGLEIDYKINHPNNDEISFISNASLEIMNILKKESPDIILTYGDTNSTFSAALVGYKMGIPIAHVEAGIRSFYTIPEEINRMFVDSVSSIKFCSSEESLKNISNGILSGDLEYDLLNRLDPKISYEDFGIMTIHRQSNMSVKNINNIFNFCKNIDNKIKFYIHHRTKKYINDSSIDIPKNIELLEPCSYGDMVESMAKCYFIITDSGSIQKTSPFFGKKTLIMRSEGREWIETENYGYSKKCHFSKEDMEWVLKKDIERNKYFYSNTQISASEVYSK